MATGGAASEFARSPWLPMAAALILSGGYTTVTTQDRVTKGEATALKDRIVQLERSLASSQQSGVTEALREIRIELKEVRAALEILDARISNVSANRS